MKFTKKSILVLSLALSLLLTACGNTKTGTGTAKGMGGDVQVSIQVKDGKIADVKAVGASETPGIGDKAIEQLPKQMIEQNSIKVDAIAGASVTSKAIMQAAEEAIKAAGLDVNDFKGGNGSSASNVNSEYEADIVVIGAGGAGMTAAITATDLGKKVIIVESQAIVGGNSVRSTGGLNAAKTTYQDKNEFKENAGLEKTLKNAKEKYASNADIQNLVKTVEKQYEDYKANPTGYFDSVELFELDTMIGGTGKNDINLVKTLCENSASAIDWLGSNGIALNNVSSFGGASVKRIHRPVNDEGKVVSVGAYVVPKLEAVVNQKGIEIVFNTTADKILMDNGKVTGVHGKTADGKDVNFKAGKVILATGGFGANLEMVEKYNPSLKGFMTTNAAGAQGQGIAMAEAVGAATVDLDQIQIHPTVEANSAALITEGLRGDGAILVNAEGKRFIDEVGTRDVVSAAEIAQTGSYSWLIVDKKMLDASTVIQGYVTKGYTKEGADVSALASAIGVDANNLKDTMEKWNSYVANGKDPEFDRTSFAKPLEAPFYAVKVTAGIHHTMGGVKINTDAQVLKADGSAIDGLYACGEVTGGVHGSNRLGGNAVCDFTVFGRIAGTNAAK